MRALRQYGNLIALALLCALLAVFTEDHAFLTARNLTNLLRSVSVTGIIAVGMTLVIVSGGIDLSVGSLVGLSGIVCAALDAQAGAGRFAAAAVAVLAAGLVPGMINGIFVARFRIPPFVITLGMMTIARGAALILSGGKSIAPLSPGLSAVGSEFVPVGASVALVGLVAAVFATARVLSARALAGLDARAAPRGGLVGAAAVPFAWGAGLAAVLATYRGLPIPVVVFAAVALLGHVLLASTRFGRYLYAVGGNEKAAHLTGIRVDAVKLGAYALVGSLAALSGVVLTARLNGAVPTAGAGYELDVIAAVVIGGTRLTGGSGTIAGTLVGVLITGVIDNGMDLLGITPFLKMIVKGVVIVLAVWLDSVARRREGAG